MSSHHVVKKSAGCERKVRVSKLRSLNAWAAAANNSGSERVAHQGPSHKSGTDFMAHPPTLSSEFCERPDVLCGGRCDRQLARLGALRLTVPIIIAIQSPSSSSRLRPPTAELRYQLHCV
jgi:hypothetical protein